MIKRPGSWIPPPIFKWSWQELVGQDENFLVDADRSILSHQLWPVLCMLMYRSLPLQYILRDNIKISKLIPILNYNIIYCIVIVLIILYHIIKDNLNKIH